jgi:glutathione synthase/RimK-type ligase-like ATP-grasp enzyme
MRVGIHPDRYKEVSPFVRKYEAILRYNNIESQFIHIDDPDFFKKVKEFDAFIFRWFHYDYEKELARTILPLVRDHLKIPCFPDQSTDWHFDDKIRQYYLMKLHGLPMTESWIFWDKEDAFTWARDASYPLIFKLRSGAGSQNVILVSDRNKAISLISRMFGKGIVSFGPDDPGSTMKNDFNLSKNLKTNFWKLKRSLQGKPAETFYQKQKNYVLFQKFLPGNEFDTRVTVIGDRAFAFRRYNRINDFRSSGSGLIDHNHNDIDLNFIKLAFKVSQKYNFQSMAYDFLYNEKHEPEFCEISYSYLDTAVHKCQGHWDSELNWHEGNYWPQFCQLQDLLHLPDLKQPDIS